MKAYITVTLLCLSLIGVSQDLYEKHEKENSDSFLIRVFPQIEFSQIVHGNWGDTTSKFKIIGFYNDTTSSGTNAIVLQSISKNKFQRLKFDYIFHVDNSLESSIVSVFFLDVNKNGIRELIVLQAGLKRCLNDDETWAACDYCEYSIFEQKIKSLTINFIESNDSPMRDQCNAKELKEYLQKRK